MLRYIVTDDLPNLTYAELRAFISSSLINRDASVTGTGWSYHDQRANAAKRELKSRYAIDTTYNGWTNYETRNMALWVDNEYSQYQARLAYLPAGTPWTAGHVKAFCTSVFPNGTPDIEGRMDKINWSEIAKHWNAE